MLPDFPSLKREIAQRLARAAEQAAHGAPLLRETPSFRQHEGSRSQLFRPDGSQASMNFDKAVTATATIKIDDVRREGGAASVRAMREIADQMAEAMTRHMLETVNEAAEEIGNVVDAKGRQLSPELIIEALEKMELSFDESGDWQPPTFVIHPDTAARMKEQIEALDKDPNTKDRVDSIVKRKREEWRAREARRALVD